MALAAFHELIASSSSTSTPGISGARSTVCVAQGTSLLTSKGPLVNLALWILQVLLSLHTAMGALWKFSHSSAETMPSLGAIPQGVWLALSGLELLCALGFVLPALSRSLARLVPIAAACIVAEMLLFTVLHVAAGGEGLGPVVYWLVVASVCAFVAYGRVVLKPLTHGDLT